MGQLGAGLSVVYCLLVGMPVFAQPSVLIEACNSIADESKRLQCLNEALKKPNQPAAHAALKELVVSVQGALQNGVSYNQYQPLVLELSRAVALLKDKKPAADAVALLDEAMLAYVDAANFWAASIRYSARNRSVLISGLVLPEADLSLAGLSALPGKYNMPRGSADAFGMLSGFPRGAGLVAIWSYAKEKTEAVFVILDGRSITPPSAITTSTIPGVDCLEMQDQQARAACFDKLPKRP